jgi:hypothetical protein
MVIAETERRPTPPKPRFKPTYILAAALLLIIIAALIMKLAFSGGKSATNADPNVVAGPSVTNSPTIPPDGPSVTNAPAVTSPSGPSLPNSPGKPAPPQDVIDYLEFVKQIEASRQALLKDTSRALSMNTQAKGLENMIGWVMDDQDAAADPLADVKKELGTHVQNWQGLIQQFNSRRPPAACAEFAGAYFEGLTSEVTTMSRISMVINSINLSSVDSMQQALSQLQQMKGDPNLQGNIDKSVGNADAKLTELSARIGIEKPFEVRKETAISTSITGG